MTVPPKTTPPKKPTNGSVVILAIIRAIHQENGGHGAAVNAGLEHATGRYFKVVDSDDWLDREAMESIMRYLRMQSELKDPTDLVIANYVYEKVHEGTRTVMNYRNVFPRGREFTWDEVGHFGQSQYLLMHSVIYRTDLLRDCGLKLPEHTFYVDNIFVYVPLPHVKTIRYFDENMYRYFIGREDQSVNEQVMYSRRDQQLRVTRLMIDSVNLPDDVESRKLEKYMENYLSMMMCICSISFASRKRRITRRKRAEIWGYLEKANPALYKRIRHTVLNWGTNITYRSRTSIRPFRLSLGAKDLQVQLALRCRNAPPPCGAHLLRRIQRMRARSRSIKSKSCEPPEKEIGVKQDGLLIIGGIAGGRARCLFAACGVLFRRKPRFLRIDS